MEVGQDVFKKDCNCISTEIQKCTLHFYLYYSIIIIIKQQKTVPVDGKIKIFHYKEKTMSRKIFFISHLCHLSTQRNTVFVQSFL